MQVQKRKRKNEKNDAKIREKNAKEVKKCSQALREVKCTYTKKNDFIFEVKTAILEAF